MADIEDLANGVAAVSITLPRVSASLLGSYFHNDCELYLARRATTRGGKAVHSELQQAIFDRGHEFEKNIATALKAAGTGFSAEEENPLKKIRKVVQLLLDPEYTIPCHEEIGLPYPEGLYVFHPRFEAIPTSFGERVPGVSFTSWEPDFLLFTRQPRGKAVLLTVLDAKASKKLKLSHQMQVTFYALALQALAEETRLVEGDTSSPLLSEVMEVAEVGGVLRPPDILERFSLALLKPLLMDFVEGSLLEVVKKGESAPYHIRPQCSTCTYLDVCQDKARKERSLSLIPYLPTSTHAHMRSLVGDRLDAVLNVAPECLPEGVAGCLETQRPVFRAEARSLAMPQPPDVSVFLSVLTHPRDQQVYGFAAYTVKAGVPSGPALVRVGSEGSVELGARIALDLAAVLRSFASTPDLYGEDDDGLPRLQLYVWEEGHRAALVDMLIAVACSRPPQDGRDDDPPAAAEVCLLSLFNEARMLLASVLPDRLGPALESGISKLSVATIRERLAHYGADCDPKMKKADALKLLKDVIELSRHRMASPERVAVLLTAVRSLVVLPVPGFYTLGDCKEWLLSGGDDGSSPPADDDGCGDDDARCFKLLVNNDLPGLEAALGRRVATLAAIEGALRAALPPSCFVLEAQPLSPTPPLNCKSPIIRKLVYMKQFEMLFTWSGLLAERVAYVPGGTEYGKTGQFGMMTPPRARPAGKVQVVSPGVDVAAALRSHGGRGSTPGKVMILRLVSKKWNNSNAFGVEDMGMGFELVFEVLDGVEFVEEDDAPKFVKWLLHRSNNPLAAITFPDIFFHNAMWPKGSTAPIAFAGVVNVIRDDTNGAIRSIEVVAHATKNSQGWLTIGDTFVLRERGRDFTTQRVLRTLLEIDASECSPLLELLEDPVAWSALPPSPSSPALQKKVAHRTTHYNELVNLETADVSWRLRLNRRQNDVLLALASHDTPQRLQLVWGPPGTGKTHCLALIILRLMEAVALAGSGVFRVLITAFTNAAIDNLMERVVMLKEAIAAIPHQEEQGWVKTVCITRIESGTSTYCGPNAPLEIVCGTVYQINKQVPLASFDMLVVDEGSQLPVPEALLALRCLLPGGRVIVAGDHEQLPPIIKCAYPSAPGEPPLFSSILHALIRGRGGASNLVMLEDNFRMNGVLSNFTQHVYGSRYHAINPDQVLDLDLTRLSPALLADSPQLERILDVDNAMVAVRVTFANPHTAIGLPYEAQISTEAEIVVRIVTGLKECWNADTEPAFFVVTPHRAQKAALLARLPEHADRIDTVERMQGREVDVVIVCYTFVDINRVAREQEFVYSRNRLNVAVSRAKKKCILVHSDAVCKPPPAVYAVEQQRNALTFLAEFVAQSVTTTWEVEEV